MAPIRVTKKEEKEEDKVGKKELNKETRGLEGRKEDK